MTIKYLNNNEINRLKWDSCLEASINRTVYACSWYLDIVSKNWGALVYGDYELIFPIIWKNFLCFKKVYHPLFCQQLGPFSSSEKLLNNQQILLDLLNILDERYRQFYFSINSYSCVSFKNIIHDNKLSINLLDRVNLELDLSFNYQQLHLNYNTNTKRNLKMGANYDFVIRELKELDVFMRLYKKNIGIKSNLKFSEYKTIESLITYSIQKKIGNLVGLYDSLGNLLASAFFLSYFDRNILLFNFSNKSVKVNTMTILIDQYIFDHSSQNIILDFEGSNMLNLKTFYKGFGAVENNYMYMIK
tara:strand:+ start:3494 stop:4402 length:909 start_codon:yes stop_codon:yes gene_type:complete